MAVFDTLVQVRATFPAQLTPAQANALLNSVAWQHRAEGWGLLRKDSGNQFAGAAMDILFNINEGKIYDVLIDAPDASTGTQGAATPAWQDKGPMDASRWLAPQGTSEPPPVVLPPPPIPTDTELDVSVVLKLVEQLIEKIDALLASNEALATVIREKQFTVKLKF